MMDAAESRAFERYHAKWERIRRQRLREDARKPKPRPSEPCVPTVTVDALKFSLRRGPAALNDPDCRRRLGELAAAQVKDLVAELRTWPGATDSGQPRTWLRLWSEGDLIVLAKAWRAAHAG